MIEGFDIIIVGQQAWDIEIGSNCKNIAIEFSKSNRVLYVNPPLDRITKIRNNNDLKIRKRINIIQGKEKCVQQIQENLWVLYPNVLIESINWIKFNNLFVCLNKKNNIQFASTIQAAIAELKFTNFCLFNDSDIFRSFYLKEILKPNISIYYSRDNITATKYWKKHGTTLEPILIKKSDLCFANSEYLATYCKRYNKNSYYVGQGCELELFETDSNLLIPDDIKSFKSPIIGYVGMLTSSRLDIDLIESIAKAFLHCSIVLVGPQDEDFEKSRLHHLNNVFFLGSKKPEDLPSYINAFDVCINPQILNELTIGNYPRKIDEYLAMGKPVVATLTETMVTFKEFVFLATDKNEFLNMIVNAMESDSLNLQMKRKEFAFSHSWENSVKKISQYIRIHQSKLIKN